MVKDGNKQFYKKAMGVFRVVFTPQRAHIVASLYLVIPEKKLKAIDNDDDSN